MLQLFYMTLNKADKDYSPTTMHKDYSINESLFHELREAHSRPMNITWKLDRPILDAIGNAMS